MREWIFDDCGGIVPSGRRTVVRVQVEGEEEVNDDDITSSLLKVVNHLMVYLPGKTVHTPGPIPKWGDDDPR